MINLNHILVATDFSEASDAAFTYGRALAARFGATLHVLHVVENVYVGTLGAQVLVGDIQEQVAADARHRLHELVMDSDNSGPTTIPAIVTAGEPAEAIVNYARLHNIDVIVVGTHGRGGLAHLLIGSIAEIVVRTAPCPVLTVRHPERDFVRPDALSVAVARA
jgi:nucleotide-binding universal stress UspA family protein